jgi:hypothetical protein
MVFLLNNYSGYFISKNPLMDACSTREDNAFCGLVFSPSRKDLSELVALHFGGRLMILETKSALILINKYFQNS